MPDHTAPPPPASPTPGDDEEGSAPGLDEKDRRWLTGALDRYADLLTYLREH